MVLIRRIVMPALFALLAAGGCKKKEEAPPSPSPDKVAGSAAGSGSANAATEQAKRLADIDAKADKEAARWTPDITKAAVAVRDQTVTDTRAAITAILASPHREPGNADRDAARHPAETLAFFGLKPDQTVIELGAGGGWYTEILAPFLADHGMLRVVAGAPGTPDGHAMDRFLAKSPEIFGKVGRVNIAPPDSMSLGPDGSADLVIAMRELHNWQRRNQLPAYLHAIHAVLKPGGTFGLEDHRAKPGAKPEDTAESGYLDQQWVIDQITAAGFQLADKSEINANPKDTKDYPKGVWSLPPTYREGDKDRAKYAAIGESDRMTLKFTKI